MIEVKNWSQDFENADTRKRQRLGWYLAPSGNESKGYRKLMREGADGVLAFGIFMAICQTLATLSKDVRKSGQLLNSDGSEMDVSDIAEVTRIDQKLIENHLPVLVECGWISIISAGSMPVACHPHASSMPQSCQSSQVVDSSTICHQRATSVPENSGFVKGEGEGEGEGEESMKAADSHTLKFAEEDSQPIVTSKNFPTLAAVLKFAKSQPIIIQPDCAETFWNDNEAAEWIDKHNRPVKNWQAALRAYASRWNQFANRKNATTKPSQNYAKSL